MAKSRRQFSRHFILLIALLITFSTNLSAQTGILRGTVTDAETNKGLAGANVIVTSGELKTGTATSKSGQFQLQNLPPGNYLIQVKHIGYELKVIPNLFISNGETKELEIMLTVKAIEFNPISISASRRPEKVLDAPASVTVVNAAAIENRTALTPTEHLKALPAVDIISAGLNQSRVVVRGFNDLFSGSLLSLIDNRITRIPAVRLNAFQLIPASNLDIERIEVVSGPASALYGPNSANGVMHVLTKSPFDSKGTIVSVGGGERSVLIGTIRHAGVLNDKIGYKFSLQYYEGNDFPSVDSTEIVARLDAIRNGADPDTLRIGVRIFDIKSTNLDGRFDFHLSPELKFIVNGGFSRGDNIEITNQGAAQALDASFKYIQGRLIYKDFFAQAFINKIGTGNTYFLRTGDFVINKSSLFVIQAQHSLSLSSRQQFTYGIDVLLTRPESEGTVNGRNEDNDNVNEIGAYLQSETNLTSKLKLLGAARIDDHNRLDGLNFSPRAALVFKPTPTNNFRLTFNRAFSTPTSDNLFSDVVGQRISTSIDPSLAVLAPFIGETLFEIRARGTWPSGFNFNFDPNGRPQMVTAFGGFLADNGFIPEANSYLPADAQSVWPAIRAVILSQIPPGLQGAFESILPAQLSQSAPANLGVINTETQELEPVDISFVRNIKPLFETTTTTFEVGYKGLIENKLLASVDLYHSKIKDFIGPLRVETPSVFINPETLGPVLAQDIANNDPNVTLEQATQFVNDFLMLDSLALLPIGVISPQEVQSGTDIILTHRNLGDVSVTGLDLSLTYQINRNWNITGNYSFINRDFFKSQDGFSDIALNAPKHKFGANLNYRNRNAGFDSNLRLRFVDSFPANSGIFTGTVDRYTILDLNATYTLPFFDNTRLNLTVQNLLNNKHREFVGLPELGRLALVRLTQAL
ncbi:TonB-dependent receptor [candidate division KSB1 bacterium]|nr:TonB-dependent receptor [candidate division KSB1 bacterium]